MWVTSDDANLDPDTGGLLIYPDTPPQDWSFEESNFNTEAVLRHLAKGSVDSPVGGSVEGSDRGPEDARERGISIGHSMDDDIGDRPSGGATGRGQRSQPMKVAYRANRCIMFRSRLFHQTDTINFRPGFKNRRINVTFLFE